MLHSTALVSAALSHNGHNAFGGSSSSFSSSCSLTLDICAACMLSCAIPGTIMGHVELLRFVEGFCDALDEVSSFGVDI